MALTIEQAQHLTNMRVRLLQNVQQGKKPEEGFTPEELSQGLAMIRQGKSASAEAQAEAKAKKGGKGKKAKAPGAPIDPSKFFGGAIDLDEDEEEETPGTSN